MMKSSLFLLLFLPLQLIAAASSSAEELVLRGFLKPKEEVTLSVRSKGVVSEIAREGSFVEAGALLMQLEDDLERIALAQQRSILEKREFEAKSYSQLQEKGGVSADQAMSARINLELARLQLDEAEVHLERTRVKAPFSGHVSRRFREPGEAVDELVPVATLVDFSEVLLEAHVSADWAGRIAEGQEVDVSVPLQADRSFRGEVSFVSPVIDPASHDFMIRVRVLNQDARLRPGMRATGRLQPPAVAASEAARP